MILVRTFRYDVLPDEATAVGKIGEMAASVCTAGKSGKARIETLLAYGLLRELLGEDFSPANLQKDANGRPYLAGLPLDFNLSHTKGLIVCAVEKDVAQPRIGVDAEALRGRTAEEMNRIAVRWFTGKEQIQFLKDPTEEAFLQIWTAKEAMAKYIGTGLQDVRKSETATEPLRLPDGTCVTLSRERIGDAFLTVCSRDYSLKKF